MTPDLSERVGVRELRQNLSVYLRRVQKGESLVVTDHGRPVARLTPLPASVDVLERLAGDGRVIMPSRSIDDVLSTTTKPGRVKSRAIMQALDEQREDTV
jgi:prevent-host-death family protein